MGSLLEPQGSGTRTGVAAPAPGPRVQAVLLRWQSLCLFCISWEGRPWVPLGDFWGWVGEGECFSLKFLGERRTQAWGSASGQGQDKCGAFSGVFLAQTSDSVVTCQGPRLSVLFRGSRDPHGHRGYPLSRAWGPGSAG